MSFYITRFFLLALCCFYCYIKLLNYKPSVKKILLAFPVSAVISLIVYVVYMHLTPLSIMALVLLVAAANRLAFRESFNINITFSIIASAISALFYAISSLVIGLLLYYSFPSIKNDRNTDVFVTVILLLFTFILLLLCFRIKRFRHGISFLKHKITGDIGVIISFTLLLITSVAYSKSITGNNIYYVFLLLAFIGILLILWWRKRITGNYVERVRIRNMEAMENEIIQQQTEIEALKANNDELAKIIHRDNKLIPAIELAVRELMKSDADSKEEKSAGLLAQLKLLTSERKGIITDYEKKTKTLPKTGIVSVDAMLRYLLCKANDANVNFDFIMNGNIRLLIDEIISGEDFNTLLADLAENSIIACNGCKPANVLVNIDTNDLIPRLDVFDSGIMFEPSTLANIGLHKITTHAKTGGSGIGMMTTWELLQKYKASLQIDETVQNDLYSKKVSIYFDKLCEYRIKTTRPEVCSATSERYDIKIIPGEILVAVAVPDKIKVIQ